MRNKKTQEKIVIGTKVKINNQEPIIAASDNLVGEGKFLAVKILSEK